MSFWQKLQKIPNWAAIGLISLYRLLLSPSVGVLRFLPFYPKPSCIFYPTCSEYAITSFKKYPFIKAFFKAIHRISRCHPGNTPSVDLP